MNLFDLMDLMNVTIKASRRPVYGGWMVCFYETVEIKNGGVFSPCHGFGSSLHFAISSLVDNIKGQRLILRAFGPDRREFHIPETLTHE